MEKKTQSGGHTHVVGKKAPVRRNNMLLYIGGFVLLVLVITVAAFMPSYGTPLYGACRTYIELHAQYPHTLEISGVEESGAEVRMHYKHIDSYGQFSFNLAVCTFKRDERTDEIVLDTVDVNRSTAYDLESKENIAEFNRVINIVLANPPDLKLPRNVPQRIEDYR